VPVRLKALKCKETDFEPRTLGEHLKKRRLILKLYQRDLAKYLDVTPDTILNWEKDRSAPPIGAMPRIVEFLGYDPFPLPAPTTLTERMRAARRIKGWSMRKAAQVCGVDGSTWLGWERMGTVPWKRYRLKVEALLAELKL
jgi:transcriptional regulator with XRE-family HTH domain